MQIFIKKETPMSARDLIDDKLTQAEALPAHASAAPPTDMARLLKARPAKRQASATLPAVTIGELLAIADDGKSPLVTYPGQPGTAALRARTVLALHGAHIGQSVVLQFEGGDPTLPIVMGVLRQSEGWPLEERPAQVEVDADGERMIVRAKEQLELRCGKASITLTRAGKVLIQGSYVLTRSTGVNRVKGGAVQIN
jgi:Domain of unknown function (DUF6484)